MSDRVDLITKAGIERYRMPALSEGAFGIVAREYTNGGEVTFADIRAAVTIIGECSYEQVEEKLRDLLAGLAEK